MVYRHRIDNRDMATHSVSIEEAKQRLDELADAAEHGEIIEIVRGGKPKLRLVAEAATKSKRVFGQHRGKIHMHENFDDPLPDSFWLGADQ